MGTVGHVDRAEVLSFEEFLRIIRILGGEGISRIRLTGGEPLVRDGVIDFVRQIKEMGFIEDLSMTTNGSLLADKAVALKQAGLDRLNISLDTVDPERFEKLTCGGNVADVLAGLRAALDAELSPVKINVVLTDEVQETDLKFFQELVRDYPVAVRFIEYMPNSKCQVKQGMSIEGVTDFLSQRNPASLQSPVTRPQGNGPARYLQPEGQKGIYGFITPISDSYCDTCNRIRLTADGKLKPCLLSEQEFDLKGPLRSGASDEELLAIFTAAVDVKPKERMFANDASGFFRDRNMSQIGG